MIFGGDADLGEPHVSIRDGQIWVEGCDCAYRLTDDEAYILARAIDHRLRATGFPPLTRAHQEDT